MNEVLCTYTTPTGKIAAQMTRSSFGSYSWIGSLGAASGSFEHVKTSLQRALHFSPRTKLVNGTPVENLKAK